MDHRSRCSVGGRFAFTLALALGLSWSGASVGAVPLPEIALSKAGRLIFGEMLEGSLVSRQILGTNVADPVRRAERLAAAFAEGEGAGLYRPLEKRLNRIYEDFERAFPQRAKQLFERGTLEALEEAERRLLRELASGYLDRAFVASVPRSPSARVRAEFLKQAEAGVAPRGAAQAAAPAERAQKAAPSASAPGLTATERALIYWETQKNAAASRTATLVPIENFEIPLRLVETDIAKRIPAELRQALVFEKNGESYVRWVINPEDTVHHLAVEKFLRDAGVSARRVQTFKAYQTASRSYIVVYDKGGKRVVFSAKVSTNHTGGNWRDKKQEVDDALEARAASDFVAKLARKAPFKNAVLMDEPFMAGITGGVDQAMLIRSLGELPSGQVTYLPGFSALHEDLGRRIAKANGSANPAEYWNEHYNKPLARSLAELAAKTGLTYDSPHSQNFLIEMVGATPTGRIVLRDFGDAYAFGDFLEAAGGKKILARWPDTHVTQGELRVSVGVAHGNTPPSWLAAEGVYDDWGKAFFETFRAEYAAQTGIDASVLKTEVRRSGAYFSGAYVVQGPQWRAYLTRVRGGESR